MKRTVLAWCLKNCKVGARKGNTENKNDPEKPQVEKTICTNVPNM